MTSESVTPISGKYSRTLVRNPEIYLVMRRLFDPHPVSIKVKSENSLMAWCTAREYSVVIKNGVHRYHFGIGSDEEKVIQMM